MGELPDRESQGNAPILKLLPYLLSRLKLGSRNPNMPKTRH
jgi:hypothetical protein